MEHGTTNSPVPKLDAWEVSLKLLLPPQLDPSGILSFYFLLSFSSYLVHHLAPHLLFKDCSRMLIRPHISLLVWKPFMILVLRRKFKLLTMAPTPPHTQIKLPSLLGSAMLSISCAQTWA